MSRNDIVPADVEVTKPWPTLSGYLRLSAKNPDSPNKQFLRTLTDGFWQEYSGIARATFQGLLATAPFYTRFDYPHELHPALDEAGQRMIFVSVSRAAAVLSCIVTEVQAYFRFDGVHIGKRLHEVWNSLAVVPEIKELYDKRYAELMHTKNITAE